jgi:hypothetical protein
MAGGFCFGDRRGSQHWEREACGASLRLPCFTNAWESKFRRYSYNRVWPSAKSSMRLRNSPLLRFRFCGSEPPAWSFRGGFEIFVADIVSIFVNRYH